jgi:propionyl-CoA carboxylase beta chain
MFVTGPEVVKTVTKEEVTKEDLGGAKMHSSVSGVSHKTFLNDIEAIASTRNLLTYLPQNCREPRAVRPWTDFDRHSQSSTKVLNNIVPFDDNKPYDMKIVVDSILDRNQFYEIMPDYAKNILTGFGEVEGRVVGIVANQP